MNILRDAWRDLLDMLLGALRLLGRHWPQLLALYLAGAAARMGFLWLALWVSKFSSLLGVLLVPLAPLSTLLSLVFMLRVMGASLPAFQDSFRERSGEWRWRNTLKSAAQVIIPFLAVYASQKLLREDTTLFVYNATADETLNNPLSANYARTLMATGPLLIGIVLVAMIIRKWIAANKLTEKALRWGVLGSYVEGLWLVTLGATLASQISTLKDWVTSRAVVQGVIQAHDTIKETPGVVGQTFSSVMTWLGGLLGSAGELVVVPVAWLAIGAMIYGSKLTARELPVVATPEQVTERLKRIPNPVQQLLAQVVEPVVTPVQNTLTAISKIAAAGVLPMIFFCVSFGLIGKLLKLAVAWAAHWVIGPQEALWQAALDPYVSLVERGAYLIVTVALVAAAVNRIVNAEREESALKEQERLAAQQAAEATPA